MTKKVKKTPGIEVNVLPRKARVDVRLIKETAERVLKYEGIRRAELSIVIVSDPAIQQLNKKYLSKDSSTDVLAFDLKRPGSSAKHLSGDIVISADTARSLSKKLGVPYAQELCRYVVHGILHLTGYDDLSLKEKEKMWQRQEGLMDKMFACAVR